MKRRVPQIWEADGWRRVVANGGAAYCLVAWALPVVILVIFGELPYLEEGSPQKTGNKAR